MPSPVPCTEGGSEAVEGKSLAMLPRGEDGPCRERVFAEKGLGGTGSFSALTMSSSSTSGAGTAAAQQAPEKEDVWGKHHELWRGKHQQQQQQEEEPSQHLCPVQSGTCKHPVSILSSSPGVEGRAPCPSPWEWLGGDPWQLPVRAPQLSPGDGEKEGVSQLPSLGCFAPHQGVEDVLTHTQHPSLGSCSGDEEMALRLGKGVVVLRDGLEARATPTSIMFRDRLPFQDVMVVGEPTLMGGEFGDEDERLITRLENTQFDAANGIDDEDSFNNSPALGANSPWNSKPPSSQESKSENPTSQASQ